MRHYEYAMALKRDSVRQYFSDETILMWIGRLWDAKNKKEKTKLANEIRKFVRKDKEVHDKLRKDYLG